MLKSPFMSPVYNSRGWPRPSMRLRTHAALFLIAGILCACPTEEPPALGDPCSYKDDGVCDEPVNCPYGTDDADCDSACTNETADFLTAGACAYREPPVDPRLEPGAGTTGTYNLSGHHDGVVMGPSGCEENKRIRRHYRLFVPANYNPARPAPMVFMLPGHRVDIYSLADYTQLQRTADLNGFILVYLEQEWRWYIAPYCSQQPYKWAWWTDWDWSASPDTNPDLVFFETLHEELSYQYNVDQSRVFAVGHSRGGAMSLIAAFELPHIFAGACSESGFSEFDYHLRIDAYEGRRIPLVFIHGAADPDVTVGASDFIVNLLEDKGWTDDDLLYYRLDNVAHRWQPQLNQHCFDFLNARPMSEGGGS
jgi:predicted esterase